MCGSVPLNVWDGGTRHRSTAPISARHQRRRRKNLVQLRIEIPREGVEAILKCYRAPEGGPKELSRVFISWPSERDRELINRVMQEWVEAQLRQIESPPPPKGPGTVKRTTPAGGKQKR